MSSASPARRLALWLGPLVGVTVILLARADVAPLALPPAAFATLGVTFWVALWWIAECMPIGATSLLPVLLLPVAGVLSSGSVAATYMDRFILLMMAGFMAALAIERSGLHRRLALAVLLRIGASPRRLVLGMLVATGVMSMWIANTAAALIMLPIGLALIARLAPDAADRPAFERFSAALIVAIAYGASIGGVATPLGTPPNLIYLGAVQKDFGAGPGFLEWMSFGVPIALVMFAFLYVYFARVVRVPRELAAAGQVGAPSGRAVLLAERAALGPMGRDEKRVALIFGSMIALWVTRQIELAPGQSIGWAPLLGLDGTVDDATVAVLGALLLFVWPSQREGERLLDWETARRIPWEVVLLFGGGLAIAKGFEVSGLSKVIGGGLSGLGDVPPVVLMASIGLTVTFLTEVTSNTAVTTLLMPLLAPFAKVPGLSPELVMLPAALAASFAFMLPVATPPNAVVYGSGRVTIAFMARTGFWLNLFGVLVVTVVLTIYTL